MRTTAQIFLKTKQLKERCTAFSQLSWSGRQNFVSQQWLLLDILKFPFILGVGLNRKEVKEMWPLASGSSVPVGRIHKYWQQNQNYSKIISVEKSVRKAKTQ